MRSKCAGILGASIHSTHMVPRVLEFLRVCRQRFPDLVIVAGGAHPTGAPEIVKEDCIDYVVIGEGEETLYELASALLRGSDPSRIKGLAYMKDGFVKCTAPRERLDFTLKFRPIRKNEILSKMKCAPLAYPAPPDQKGVAQIAYSRGCPFKCEFCVSPIVFPRDTIYRDPEDVMDELKQLKRDFGTNFVFFNDLTFNHYPPRVHDLCDKLIEENLGINWFAYVSVHLIEEVVKTMAEAGCSRAGMGAESLVDYVLTDVKPQQRVANTRKSLQMTDKYGILNRTYLMFGYPSETKETLVETLEVMKSLPIDQPRLAFITPFPGTTFYYKVQDQLITRDPEKFTGDHPVIKNPNISSQEYVELRDWILSSYYDSQEYHDHVADKCRRHPRLIDSFRFFFGYLRNKEIVSQSAYARLLRTLDEEADVSHNKTDPKQYAYDPVFA